jgi:alpha-ketoglutarate-dependent taurine dioxygenase
MEPEHSGPSKFTAAKRRAVRLTQEALVTTHYLRPDQTLPLLIQPGPDDLNPPIWAKQNRQFIEACLARHGALLFRNFNLNSIFDFESFAGAVWPQLIQYGERSSPRTSLGNGIYTSTDHPPALSIVLHNEQSYTLNWPMKIWFFCLQPAQDRGRTPIADSRKILNRLPARIIDRFEHAQVMYVRNYHPGLGLSWREAFQTNERAVVERYCLREGIEVEWREGEGLRTRQLRPAVRKHPWTGDRVWFNHAMFFHLSSLEASTRETMLAVVGEQQVPFNTFYGDGTAIEPSVIEEIRAAYDQETVTFDWEAGDLLLVDNMLVAHGREPFVGDRKVLVAMAQPFKEFETSPSSKGETIGGT